jgi:hypothetical protein
VQRVMIPNDYLAGIDMLRQDYLAAVLELNSAGALSKPRLDLLRAELRKNTGFIAQQNGVLSAPK